VFAEESPVAVQTLSAESTSWDKSSFTYPVGNPKISIQKITVTPPHGKKEFALSNHCHLMPLAAYVTKGSVKVVKKDGESKTFNTGDAFIEVSKLWHKGVFTEPSELIVFYAGNDQLPLSVKNDGDPILAIQCK